MSNRVAALLAKPFCGLGAESSDRELLRRYTEFGDQTAFAAIVQRHSTLVLGVCRRQLKSAADAEDASQAVFLILARRAKSVRWQTSAANWLYATARQVSLNAGRAAVRRRKREATAAQPEKTEPVDGMSAREWATILDEELGKLPALYREPLILCYLEGLTRDEAATRLGVAEAALKKRLERGRRKLADALAARGCAVGITLLAASTAAGAGRPTVPLHNSVLEALGGSPSAAVSELVRGCTMTGGIVSLKLGLVAAIALALIGFGFAAAPIPEAPQAAAQPTLKQEIKPDAEKPEEQDRIIRGRVLGHDGKPVVAEFTLFWNSGLPQSLGKTKDDGRFELTVPFRLKDYGGYLLARAPGHGFDFLPHGLPHVADSLTKTLDLEWKIPKERAIRGKLVDKEGRPIAGAILRVQYVFAYDTPATADRELVRWAKDLFRNNPLADRSLQFLSPTRGNADDPYPFATTTDADGKYELRGLGAEQLIRMHIEATGFAHRDIAVLNRDGYNPAPINQLERDRVPKGETRYQFLKIFGPDPTVALEQEKVIRGKITDPQGRPLAAIKVSQTRFDDHELNHQRNHAITGPDGIYEIHGAPKHDKYMVECPYETNLGLLPCQVWADSTPGYGPMTVDLKYTKGVLVTGRIVDKSTGEPLQALFVAEPMAKNPFLKKFGNFQEAATSERGFYTDKQGRFRIVTIPGPVLLMGGPNRDDFKPAKPDPKYPDYFRRQEEGSLLFLSAARGEAHVQGCWCRVIDAEDTEKEIAISIELEPASKLNVAVVDDRGQAVKDIRATGTTHILFGHPELFSGTNLVTVRNVEPDEERLVTAVHEKRKLIGWSMVKATDKMPKITLGTGGSARGRVIDPEGTPLAGILIRVKYAQRPLSIAHEELTKRNPAMTDEKGEFRLDSLFAEQPFQLEYIQDRRLAGDLRKAPWFTVKNEPEALRIPEATVKPPKK